jgi:cyclic pyranopterin phosphate synthase
MPLDQFQREINYLRISLTDHCNLRCVYCMPTEGLKFAPPQDLLTAQEIANVVRSAVNIGFRKFRLTGGEPTLRGDLLDIVRLISDIPGVSDLSMTTNGVLLDELAKPLVDAGLKRINIHVDTLDSEALPRLMLYSSVDRIWAGIEAAEAAGMHPIKINVVVTEGYNEKHVVEMAALTLDRDWHVRFIELMPLGEGGCAQAAIDCYVSNVETLERISDSLGELTPIPPQDLADESRNFRLPNARGVVGFISPVSEPYCGNCNRMRLTADGKFHLCLLNDDEVDVRGALRNGGGPSAVEKILLRAVEQKPTGHQLEQGRHTRQRQMFQIGG